MTYNYTQKQMIHKFQIGAGTALPGILAAKCGARVTLSDSSTLPDCLQRCQASADTNKVSDVQVLGITWGIITSQLAELPPQDIILASDCFYDSKG